MYLKDNMQNWTLSWLYTDDKKKKYYKNLINDILKSAKNFYEKFIPRDSIQIYDFLNFLAKFLTGIKSQMNNFTFMSMKFLLNFINIFSKELPPILLDLFDFWDELDTMRVGSRTRVISVIYKKGDKKGNINYRPISLLNLDWRIYTSILKTRMQQP